MGWMMIFLHQVMMITHTHTHKVRQFRWWEEKKHQVIRKQIITSFWTCTHNRTVFSSSFSFWILLCAIRNNELALNISLLWFFFLLLYFLLLSPPNDLRDKHTIEKVFHSVLLFHFYFLFFFGFALTLTRRRRRRCCCRTKTQMQQNWIKPERAEEKK